MPRNPRPDLISEEDARRYFMERWLRGRAHLEEELGVFRDTSTGIVGRALKVRWPHTRDYGIVFIYLSPDKTISSRSYSVNSFGEDHVPVHDLEILSWEAPSKQNPRPGLPTQEEAEAYLRDRWAKADYIQSPATIEDLGLFRFCDPPPSGTVGHAYKLYWPNDKPTIIFIYTWANDRGRQIGSRNYAPVPFYRSHKPVHELEELGWEAEDILRKNPRPAELHLYDFDGTLFRSPHKPADWQGHWWSNPVSLEPPIVPAKPNKTWWVDPVVAQARQSIAAPHVYAVLATGRKDRAFRYRVPELLGHKRLAFDAVHLSDRESTLEFKLALLDQLLNRYPFIEVVRIWDDRTPHLAAFKAALGRRGVAVACYPVVVQPKPVARGALRNPKAPKPTPVPDPVSDPRGYALHLEDQIRALREMPASPERDDKIREFLALRQRALNRFYVRQQKAAEKAEGAKRSQEDVALEKWVTRKAKLRARTGKPLAPFTPDMPEVQKLGERMKLHPVGLAQRLQGVAEALGIPTPAPDRERRYAQPVVRGEGYTHLGELPRWLQNRLQVVAAWSIGRPAVEWAQARRQDELRDLLWDVFVSWAMDPASGAYVVTITPEGRILVDAVTFRADQQRYMRALKVHADRHLQGLLASFRAVMAMQKEVGGELSPLLVAAPDADEGEEREKGAEALDVLARGTKSQRAQAAVIRMHLGWPAVPGQPSRFLGLKSSQAAKDFIAYHGPEATKKGTCPSCRAITRFFRTPGLTVAHVQQLMKWWGAQEQAGRG